MDVGLKRYRKYGVHGEGIETLGRGFDEIGLSAARRSAAVRHVEEVLAANAATGFVWYLQPTTPELCCYWDLMSRNLLWVSPVSVHVKADGVVTLPVRPRTYSKADGTYVGWLLPGAETGTGGGPRRAEPRMMSCPASGIRFPPGTLCPDCDVLHP